VSKTFEKRASVEHSIMMLDAFPAAVRKRGRVRAEEAMMMREARVRQVSPTWTSSG
jgi:hypothetical protein